MCPFVVRPIEVGFWSVLSSHGSHSPPCSQARGHQQNCCKAHRSPRFESGNLPEADMRIFFVISSHFAMRLVANYNFSLNRTGRTPMADRCFPPPWTVEETDACFIARGGDGPRPGLRVWASAGRLPVLDPPTMVREAEEE
jgi:hypothetical protein